MTPGTLEFAELATSGGVVTQPPAIGDIKDIVVFGLLFVSAAALANGLSVTPQMVWGPLKKNAQLSVFAIIGNFLVLPALVIGFLLADRSRDPR